jgi:hypothetical protein
MYIQNGKGKIRYYGKIKTLRAMARDRTADRAFFNDLSRMNQTTQDERLERLEKEAEKARAIINKLRASL